VPETVAAISLEGRTFPVDVMYLDEPSEDYIESALKTVMDIHSKVCHLYDEIDIRNRRAIYYCS
jgi:hypothetical protein